MRTIERNIVRRPRGWTARGSQDAPTASSETWSKIVRRAPPGCLPATRRPDRRARRGAAREACARGLGGDRPARLRGSAGASAGLSTDPRYSPRPSRLRSRAGRRAGARKRNDRQPAASPACVRHGANVPPRASCRGAGSSAPIATASERSTENMRRLPRMASCHQLIKVIGKCLRPVPHVAENAGMTTFAGGTSASSVGASSRSSDSLSNNTIVGRTRWIDRAQRRLS